jgi:type I restriction enzyme S subunit
MSNDIPDLICSTGFSVLRCNRSIADPGYVFFHLFAEEVGHQIESLLAGSNYPAINSSDVKAIQIPFPALAEQGAVAEILSDMDAEIAALEKKRNKTRALKQAMMQELLTGKTRLI